MCTVLLLPRRPLLYTGFGICRPFIFKLASVRPDRRVPRVRTSHRNVSALWPLCGTENCLRTKNTWPPGKKGEA